MAYTSQVAIILNTYGIGTPQKLAKVGGCRFDHAKKILLGHRPISKKVALRLKNYTKNKMQPLTTDSLFALTEDNRRGK